MSDSTVIREQATGVEAVTLAGKKVAVTPFCNYKFSEACRLLAEMIEEAGVQELMSVFVVAAGESPLHQAMAFAPILPKMLRKLPESVCNFVALCSIANDKLLKLYGKDPGITGEVEKQAKEILFKSEPPELVHALGVYLGMLDLQELGNEIRQAADVFSSLVGLATQEETAG